MLTSFCAVAIGNLKYLCRESRTILGQYHDDDEDDKLSGVHCYQELVVYVNLLSNCGFIYTVLIVSLSGCLTVCLSCF